MTMTASIHNVLDFGAIPDGTTMSTASLQQAINACHQAGGGQVLCGPGTFLTGSLLLKSGVELHLSSGCRLVGSPNLEDYERLVADGFLDDYAPEKSAHALIRAVCAENIAITGSGTIDGGGLAFYDHTDQPGKLEKPATSRPRIGMFFRCLGVRIEGVSFVDSACWTLWLMQCERVRIHRIEIEGNRRLRNVDGIDIDACRDVIVSDCRIDTEDDCLVLRAIQRLYDTPAICENVVVTNCVLDSGCQGIRIGCPGDGTIRNSTFSNLVIRSSNNGILCEHPHRYMPAAGSASAHITDIRFSNIIIDCKRAPIKVIVEEGIALRRLAALSFSDITIRSGDPCRIQGCPQTIIEDIRFSNVQIETSGNDAILCRHCRGTHLTNVTLTNRAQHQ